jgi:hypothetical protein
VPPWLTFLEPDRLSPRLNSYRPALTLLGAARPYLVKAAEYPVIKVVVQLRSRASDSARGCVK